MNARHRVLLIITIPILLCVVGAVEDATIYGTWQFNRDESTDIVTWRYRKLRLEIRDLGDTVAIDHDWRHRGYGSWRESVTIRPGGEPTTDIVESPIWPANWYMGVLAAVGGEKTTTATWLVTGRRLATETEQVDGLAEGIVGTSRDQDSKAIAVKMLKGTRKPFPGNTTERSGRRTETIARNPQRSNIGNGASGAEGSKSILTIMHPLLVERVVALVDKTVEHGQHLAFQRRKSLGCLNFDKILIQRRHDA